MSAAPLRILHTESSLGWGGQEIRILTEARGVARHGHEVAIAAPPEARIHAEASAYGIEIVVLPIARKGLTGLASLRRFLASRPFDIVNTHSSTDSWLVALAGVMGDWAPAGVHPGSTLPGAGVTRPIVRTRHISSPVPRNAATRWLYGRASRIVTTGEKLRLQVIEETGVDAARVISIPTGIDLAHFAPGDAQAARAALGLPARAKIIGIVATLRSWKGHRFLLEAFARMARADAMLVVVGDGPVREATQRQAAELRIGDRVRFVGNQRDVAPWLRAFDLFCLPSYANEGVPQALAQAMACALPVVTTPVGSIEELFANVRTGVLVPPSDADALARALGALLDDPARARALGAAAHRHARERLGEEAMIGAMIEVFSRAGQACA
jgi:glycosyltransferase involved in cell wall biosynthesis